MTHLYASDFPWCLEPLLPSAVNLRRFRSNLLVNCSPDELQAVANELAKLCAPPVQMCFMPGWLDLPANFAGTLFLTRIEEMTIDQQSRCSIGGQRCIRRSRSYPLRHADRQARERRPFLEGLFYGSTSSRSTPGGRGLRAPFRISKSGVPGLRIRVARRVSRNALLMRLDIGSIYS